MTLQEEKTLNPEQYIGMILQEEKTLNPEQYIGMILQEEKTLNPEQGMRAGPARGKNTEPGAGDKGWSCNKEKH